MTAFTVIQGDLKAVPRIVLVLGALLRAGGLFGVWLQGMIQPMQFICLRNQSFSGCALTRRAIAPQRCALWSCVVRSVRLRVCGWHDKQRPRALAR